MDLKSVDCNSVEATKRAVRPPGAGALCWFPPLENLAVGLLKGRRTWNESRGLAAALSSPQQHSVARVAWGLRGNETELVWAARVLGWLPGEFMEIQFSGQPAARAALR